MVQNDDYLYENMIRGYYNVYGVVRETGLVLRAGYVKTYFTEAWWIGVNHYYAKPFLPGVRPVVATALTFTAAMRLDHALRGLDGQAVPDHRGFLAGFWNNRDKGGPSEFRGEQWLGYIALGHTA